MSLPNFTPANSIAFGTWVGVAPIYILNNDTSGAFVDQLQKIDIELSITLNSVESSQSGIVKVDFLNESIGIYQSVLAYNQKCHLYFDQLSLISSPSPTIMTKSFGYIELSVGGDLEFIEDGKLKLILSGSIYDGDFQRSIASQSIFTQQLLV